MSRSAVSPFPIGESPFRVKGSIYLGTQRYFEDHAPGKLEQLTRELDESMAQFIRQKFLAVGWYDALPIPTLSRAEAKALGKPLRTYLRERAQFQARHDLSGVYRVVLSVMRPRAVALRLPGLAKQFYDFGEISVSSSEDREVVAVFEGFPAAMWEMYTTSLVAYTETALAIAGASTTDVSAGVVEELPPQHGVPVVRGSIRARWL